ncbi:MAG TPA: helix-turn-helix domain-containing protein [Thermoanaerobaculia bacterium]|nr:helix-turn-helix domain-containing protein [Thermoanaerobaculia bacterium]
MADKVPPSLNLTLMYLRSALGWRQQKLAEATGIAANLLSDYERGRKTLSRERLETIVAAMDLPSSTIDGALLFLRSVYAAAEDPGPAAQKLRIEAAAVQTGQITSNFTRTLFGKLSSEARGFLARERAAAMWERLRRLAPEQRRLRVESTPDLRSWALCELLCEESLKAAADNADRALELASLALRGAELMPGEEAWRSRVQGYAWAHIGNARRVRGDLPGAEEAFRHASKLWEAGEIGDLTLLNEARVLGVKASLRQSQRRFPEALELLDRALAVDEGPETRYLLLNKARIFEELGRFDAAIAELRRAAPLVELEGEPRFLLALRLNLAVNLSLMGRHGEVESAIPELRKLAAGAGNHLDLVRLRWLEGRIAVGMERRQEAIKILSRVREEFTSLNIAYDMALVSLELAELYLEEGRTAEVRALARQTVPIFEAQGVHREALAALKLFNNAAEHEAVTLDLAKRLIAYFLRARHDPGLRFEEV